MPWLRKARRTTTSIAAILMRRWRPVVSAQLATLAAAGVRSTGKIVPDFWTTCDALMQGVCPELGTSTPGLLQAMATGRERSPMKVLMVPRCRRSNSSISSSSRSSSSINSSSISISGGRELTVNTDFEGFTPFSSPANTLQREVCSPAGMQLLKCDSGSGDGHSELTDDSCADLEKVQFSVLSSEFHESCALPLSPKSLPSPSSPLSPLSPLSRSRRVPLLVAGLSTDWAMCSAP